MQSRHDRLTPDTLFRMRTISLSNGPANWACSESHPHRPCHQFLSLLLADHIYSSRHLKLKVMPTVAFSSGVAFQ